MTNLAQLGVLYVFIMLVILAIGFGLLALKGMDRLIKWVQEHSNSKEDAKEPEQKSKWAKSGQAQWIKLAYVSVIFLFLSIFSLGILKTLGVSDDHNSHHSGSTQTTQMTNEQFSGGDSYQMQQQLNYLNGQLLQIEASLNQSANY